MKRLSVLTIVLLASMVAAGCTDYKSFIPVVNSTITPTVGPSHQASATVTPVPSGTLPLNLKEYQTGTAPNAFLGKVLVSHPTYYARDDLEMPILPESGLKPAHHGAIHKLEFWNPTDENKTVYVSDLSSTFKAFVDDQTHYVLAQQMFYDPDFGFFGQFVLLPHERRTVYLYAYITDEDFEKYKGQFTVGGVAFSPMVSQ